MKANEYRVLSDCVERGVGYGYNRAHKHTDNPVPELLRDTIADAVLNEIAEYFRFDETENTENELLNHDERRNHCGGL